MLPKRVRLKRGRLFPKTLQSGRRLSKTPYFIIVALPRAYASATPTLYGFIVSKKVHNKANRRNLIKRRYRSLVREHVLEGSCNVLDKYITVVLIGVSGALEASYSQMSDTFKKALHRIAG